MKVPNIFPDPVYVRRRVETCFHRCMIIDFVHHFDCCCPSWKSHGHYWTMVFSYIEHNHRWGAIIVQLQIGYVVDQVSYLYLVLTGLLQDEWTRHIVAEFLSFEKKKRNLDELFGEEENKILKDKKKNNNEKKKK